MRDFLEMLGRRFLAVEGVEQALMQIVSPSRVRAAARSIYDGAPLLTRIADEFGFDPDALMIEIGRILEVEYCPQPLLPTKSLIDNSGYTAVELRERGALPQQKPSRAGGWELLVSDTKGVAIEEYRARGIDVRLCCPVKMEGIWSDYFALLSGQSTRELVRAQLDALLKRVITDAEGLGAKEVFIGHPRVNAYEFVAAGNRYTGKIHSGAYHSLLRELEAAGSLERSLENSELRVSLAVTKNFSHSIVYLSWVSGSANSHCSSSGTLLEDQTIHFDVTLDNEELPAVPQASDVDADPTVAEQHTIVVVDDDEQFAEILERVLERRGYHVRRFADVEFAFEAITAGEIYPSLIVSDVHLPSANGGDFLRMLRDSGNRTPLILLTSDEDELLEAELVSRGADAFLRKQEDVRVLLAWCKNLLMRDDTSSARGIVDAA